MKSSWAILLLLILCFSVRAEVEVATSPDDVQTFLEENKDNTVALLFIDSSHNGGKEGGFWKGIVTSVSHIFSGEEGPEGAQQKAASIEKALADEADLIKIDVSKGILEEVMDEFEVQTVPYIIVIKKGVVVLKEVPTNETHDKILQILNVNPAPVHAEPTSEEAASATPASVEPVAAETPTEEPTPHTIEVEEESTDKESPEEDKSIVETAEDWYNSLFGSDKDETPEEDKAKPAEESAKPVTKPKTVPIAHMTKTVPVVSKPKLTTAAPQPKPQPKDRPAYPQSRTEPTKDEDMVAASDTRQKWVHHQCHELNTYEDERASHWRDTPFYISELEDSELPEEWWKNGYKPIKTNSTERMNRVFQGPQTAVLGAKETITVVPAEPVVIVAPVERFEPYHVHRPEPVIVAEPLIRPEPVIVAEPHYRPQPVVVAEPHYRPQPVVVAEPHYRPQPVVVAEPHIRPQPVVVAEPHYRPQPVVVAEPHHRARTVAAPQKPSTETTATTSGKTTTRTTTGAPSAPKQVSMREVTGQAPATTQTTAPTNTRRATSTGSTTRPATSRPATATTRPTTSSTRPASTGSRTSAGPRPSGRTSASSTTVKPTSSTRR